MLRDMLSEQNEQNEPSPSCYFCILVHGENAEEVEKKHPAKTRAQMRTLTQQCRICFKKFPGPSALNHHMRVHTGKYMSTMSI